MYWKYFFPTKYRTRSNFKQFYCEAFRPPRVLLTVAFSERANQRVIP